MFPYRLVEKLLLVVVSAGGIGAAESQEYPSKPVRIITSSPGGGSDFNARMVAQGISAALGQNVFVDNRPSGVIPGEVASRAAPDGYTLLVATGNFWIGPFMQPTPYDPVKDFSAVSMTSKAPSVVVVHPLMPVKSIRDLIALAKARPSELNYATTSSGSPTHLATELFNHMARVKIVRVSYKASSSATIDLISGQVQLMFAPAASVAGHIKSGRLRGLAVTGTEPSPIYPNVPTVMDSGLPGYSSEAMTGVFVPARTPDAVIRRLNQEIVRYLKTPDAQERFLNSGYTAAGSSPEQFATMINSEMVMLGKVIKEMGIRSE